MSVRGARSRKTRGEPWRRSGQNKEMEARNEVFYSVEVRHGSEWEKGVKQEWAIHPVIAGRLSQR